MKAISNVFGITIDRLLSGDGIIKAAQDEKKENAISLRTILYGLLDVMGLVFFAIPLFGERNDEFIESVSLLSMRSLEGYVFVAFAGILGITVAFGVAEITLQNYRGRFWKRNQAYFSMALTIVAMLLFIMSQQPYVAVFQFWLLVIKGVLYIKQNH